MRIAVTGATGFLGRQIVGSCIRGGFQTVGIARSVAAIDGAAFARADLRDPAQATTALAGMDVVIHAAASARGSRGAWSDTTLSTRVLFDALAKSNARVVLISSLSVLNFAVLAEGDIVDEDAALEHRPADRDAYARAKLEQERLAIAWRDAGHELAIVRPGAIVDAQHAWTARLGIRAGGRWLQVGDAEVPTIHVAHCADTIVSTALHMQTPLRHLVDDDAPTVTTYASALAALGLLRPPTARIRFSTLDRIAAAVWPVIGSVGPLRRRAPGILVPARLAARFRAVRFRSRVPSLEPRRPTTIEALTNERHPLNQ